MTSATIAAPLPLRGITLKNRVIRSATHSFLCSKDGYMTEAEYAMYETLAQNGVGTIITGHCSDARIRSRSTYTTTASRTSSGAPCALPMPTMCASCRS